VLIGVVLFSPVLWWNAWHGWAGVIKQGGRIGDWRPVRALGFEAELVGGQIGLATPWIWVLCMAALIVAVRRSWQLREPRWSLLAALSLPPVLVFLQHAIGDRVQGNWPAIIYPALVVAAAGWRQARRDAAWVGAATLGFAMTAVVYLQACLGLLPLPTRFDPIALRLNGWDDLAQRIEAARVAAGAAYVAAEGYAPDSELAWWLPPSVPVVGVDARWALFGLPPARIGGVVGLLLRDARRTDPPDAAAWAQAERIGMVERGDEPPAFALYRVIAADRPPVTVALPRRR
jgi:hypothetical protein